MTSPESRPPPDYSYLRKRRLPEAVLRLRDDEISDKQALNRYRRGEYVSPNHFRSAGYLQQFTCMAFPDWRAGKAVGQFDLEGTLHMRKVNSS